MTSELRAKVEKLRDECEAMWKELDALAESHGLEAMDLRFRYFEMAEGFLAAVTSANIGLEGDGEP